MARARSPNRDKAFELWKESNGTLPLKEIAEELDISATLVRKWKNQDKWEDTTKGNVTKSKSNVTNRKGAPKGNKNAQGNGAPKKNQNAVTHGFFSKFLPSETLEIMKSMQERSAADLIYDQIQIQYAAIIRAQRIMFVNDKDEMIKELKKEKTELSNEKDRNGNIESIPTFVEREYEFQFAWDRHATFLNAQSRAISILQSLIKQFDGLAHDEDERRLKLEQMRLNIDKTKAEIKDEVSTGSRVVIVNNKEAMRKALENGN